MKKLFLSTLAACVMVSTSVIADPIADRKAVMKNVGMAMGTLVKMVKGQMDYDPNAALLAFAVMNNASHGLTSLFPAGSETGGESTAHAKIWSDMGGFEAAVGKFNADTAAAIAAKPADAGAFKAAFGQVAGNCKSCHETYRLPPKQ